MTTERVVQQLREQLAERGWQVRIVAAQRRHDLRVDFEGLQGLLDPELRRRELSGLGFELPETLPGAKSLVVVAVPRPQTQVVFAWDGDSWPILLPPTYTGYQRTTQRVQDLLAGVLEPAGYRVARAGLPLKLLAVRSGLGSYGRNNICYVPGMGSFLQLAAFYTDLPAAEDGWQEARMLESCQKCAACRRACPTAAITSERFLLHAERCLVFFNEGPDDFPAWIDPSWHNCLLGCIHCQRVCPEDRELLGWVEQVGSFSQEETALLLADVPLEQLPTETVGELERTDLLEDKAILSRNLGILLSQRKKQLSE